MLKHSSIFNLLSPQPTGHPSALDSSKISNFLFAAAHIWNHNVLGSAQASRRVTDLNVGPNPTLPRGWGFRFSDGEPRGRRTLHAIGSPENDRPTHASRERLRLARRRRRTIKRFIENLLQSA